MVDALIHILPQVPGQDHFLQKASSDSPQTGVMSSSYNPSVLNLYISHDISALEHTFVIIHPVFTIISKPLIEKDPCLIHYGNSHTPRRIGVTINLS